MADDKIMEALARIEYKIDLLLWLNPGIGGFPQMSDPRNTCPACKQPVAYNVDIEDAVVIRKCGCSTGKIALDLKAFAPPVLPARKTDNGGRDDEQEDGGNPNRGSGKPRGR